MRTVHGRVLHNLTAGEDRYHIAPAIMAALILAGAGAASSASSSMANRRSQREGNALTREQIAAEKEMQLKDIAAKEGMLDPFRDQLAQAGAIGKLDMMERASYSPTRMTPAGPYAEHVPNLTGGFSYEASPEMRSSASALKRSVMSGQGAPSQAIPGNVGRTGALDLLRIAAGEVDAGAGNAFAYGNPVRPPMRGAAGVNVNNRAVPRAHRPLVNPRRNPAYDDVFGTMV